MQRILFIYYIFNFLPSLLFFSTRVRKVWQIDARSGKMPPYVCKFVYRVFWRTSDTGLKAEYIYMYMYTDELGNYRIRMSQVHLLIH